MYEDNDDFEDLREEVRHTTNRLINAVRNFHQVVASQRAAAVLSLCHARGCLEVH